MTGQLPTDGVRLVLQDEQQFVSGLKRVDAVWDETVKRFRTAEGTFAKTASGMESTGTAATGLTSAAGGLSVGTIALGNAAEKAAVQIGKQFVQAVEKAVSSLFEMAQGASQLQGISMQFAILTQDVEGGAEGMLRALQEASGGMLSARDLMTQFNSAAALVNRSFAQQLPQALSLLTKISASTGRSMDYLLESLTFGIGRLTPKVLDNLMIQVSIAEATAHATQMFNKEAEALTTLEKQTAYMDLTMTKLEEKFGALPDTTRTLTAQTTALQASFENIRDTIGAFVVPGFTALVEAANKVVGAFSAALGEGGKLEPLLISLGSWFSLWADGVAILADRAIETVESMTGEMSTGIGDTITEALEWGFELVAAFAEGIVSATSTVLVQAMNAVSEMLTSWLLGASPPKVAPNIVGWGISLMEQYLEGMTQADFDVLGKVQGPLKKILEGPAFANISKALAGALAGGDRAGFLAQIEQVAGVFGQAVRELASLNFQLADSVLAVQDAEEALARSREHLQDSQAEVNRQTAEYNRLLREGVSRDVLDAQLGQINAAEENMRAVAGQVTAEEAAVQAAKDRKTELEGEAKLQQGVVDQLLAVNDALAEQDKAKEKAEKAKKGGLAEVPELSERQGIPAGLDLGGRIGAAIDEAKKKLAAKMAELMQPLRDAIANIKLDLGTLGEAWDNFISILWRAWRTFTGVLSQKWDMMKERFPILQDVEDWIRDLPGELGKAADTLSTVFSAAVEGAAIALGNTVVTGFLYNAEKIYSFFKDTFLPYMTDTFKVGMLSDFVDGLLVPIATGFTNIGNAIQFVIDQIDRVGGLANLAGMVGVGMFGAVGAGSTSRAGVAVNPMEGGGLNQQNFAGMLPSTQQLAPVSNTAVTVNAGGNTFNNGMDQATFDARLEQAIRRGLRR